MLTVWWDVEIGMSVVVKLTRFWLSWDVVEMFTAPVTGARHSTANNFRSSWYFWGHFCIQRWGIQRTQSCCIRRTCHQFHWLLLSFISRQQHHKQPWNWRQNVYWRHFCFRERKRQLYDYLPKSLCYNLLYIREWALSRGWCNSIGNEDNTFSCMDSVFVYLKQWSD